MKKIILLLLFVIGQYGCEKTEYNPPQNIVYNEETSMVSWSSAPNATSYEILINESRYETSKLFYDLSSFVSGTYSIKVRSIFKNNVSMYSIPIEVTIIKEIKVNVTLEDDILTFNSETNNIKYTIRSFNYLGELENTIPLVGSTYKVISNLGFNHFEVEGMLNGSLIYKKTIFVNIDGYTYFKGEEYMKINEIKGNKVFINDTLLDENSYLISTNGLSIFNSYLNTLGLGKYLLKVDGEDIFLSYITLSETKKPKLTSASEVSYTGSDVKFIFNMYDGSFIGIYSTPNITNEDYSFIDGVLTINKDFIDSIKLNEPARKQIFFQYELVNQELTVIGYLSIRLID